MIWTPRTTVAAIVERDGRFLVVEETAGDGLVLNQPAGHLDEGESLLDAVMRETREETAWRFHPLGLIGIYRWQVPPSGETYLRFCFWGMVDDHRPEQALDEGIQRVSWISLTKLERTPPDRLRSPLVLRSITDYVAGRRYDLDLLVDL